MPGKKKRERGRDMAGDTQSLLPPGSMGDEQVDVAVASTSVAAPTGPSFTY